MVCEREQLLKRKRAEWTRRRMNAAESVIKACTCEKNGSTGSSERSVATFVENNRS